MSRLRAAWRPLVLGGLSLLLLVAACSGHTECNGPAGLCIEAAGGSASRRPDPPEPTAGGEGGGLGEASAGIAGAVLGDGGATSEHEPVRGGAGHASSAGGQPDSLEPGAAGAPATGEAGADGAAGAPEVECTGGQSITPYLAISDVFVPAGYGELDWVELLGLAECPDRPNDARGSCYGFEWTPYQLDHVYLAWVYDEDWGDADQSWNAICVEAGATKLSFQARGEYAGQLASFGWLADVGGEVVLSDTWQTYEIDLHGVDYGHYVDQDGVTHPGVQIGFWMYLDHPEQGIQRIFVDDIRLTGSVTQCTPPGDPPSVCELPAPAPAAAVGSPGWCGPQLGEEPADPSAPTLLIDDLEDGDEWSLPLPGARAIWRTLSDGSSASAQYPDCPRPTPESVQLEQGETSSFSMRTSGCGFRSFGAGVELLFRGGSPDCDLPFDARSYDGVEFWLDIRQVNSKRGVTFRLNTSRTVPVADGGSCTENCYANSFNAPVGFVPEAWTKVRIPFYALRQMVGPYALLDPATVFSMSWVVEGDEEAGSFDFAIDDVRLYRVAELDEPGPKP